MQEFVYIVTRVTGGLAIALILFVAALPAAAACGVGTNACTASSMHASMPCCAQGCSKLNAPDTNRRPDIALTATPSPLQPLQVVADAAVVVAEPIGTGFDRPDGLTAGEFSDPPPFLLHRQFRI